jgi:phage-related tail protein
LSKQPYDNLIKINSKLIQLDRYIVNNLLFESYALAEIKVSSLVQDVNNERIKSFEHYLQINFTQKYRDFQNTLSQYSDFIFYTDGFIKYQRTIDAIIGSAILMVSPIKKSINFMVKENISVFIAELFPILIILIIISHLSHVEINTDSNIIYVNYEKWKNLSI